MSMLTMLLVLLVPVLGLVFLLGAERLEQGLDDPVSTAVEPLSADAITPTRSATRD